MIEIIAKGLPTKISENVSAHEIDCHCSYECCRSTIYSTDLIRCFEALRALSGSKPLTINCGYRCPRHNYVVDGVIKSNHMIGHALDIAYPAHLSKTDFVGMAKSIFAFVLPYETFIHADIIRRN